MILFRNCFITFKLSVLLFIAHATSLRIFQTPLEPFHSCRFIRGARSLRIIIVGHFNRSKACINNALKHWSDLGRIAGLKKFPC